MLLNPTHSSFLKCCFVLITSPSWSRWPQKTPWCPLTEPCSMEPAPWRQTSQSGYPPHIAFLIPAYLSLMDWGSIYRSPCFWHRLIRGSMRELHIHISMWCGSQHIAPVFGCFFLLSCCLDVWLLYFFLSKYIVNNNSFIVQYFLKILSLPVWTVFPFLCETAHWSEQQTSVRSFQPDSMMMPLSSTGLRFAL